MGFSNNRYAKVWQVKEGKGNYTDVRLSTSKKDQRTGEYEQDFSGWVRFVGKAHEIDPTEGDRIKLLSVDVTNSYDKQKNVTYWNAVCFEWELAEGSNNVKGDEGFLSVPDSIDEELPFN